MFGAVGVFVAAVMCVFGITNADVLPSAKCNTSNIKVVPVTYSENVNLVNWKVLYVTDSPPFSDMDYFLIAMTPNSDSTYQENDTIMYKNSTSSTQSYNQTYVDNIITQDATESTGKSDHFHLYPLDVADNSAILYLRCCEVAGVAMDTRFIAVPNDTKLSDAGLKQLMATDASYSFTGDLYKLPYSMYKSS